MYVLDYMYLLASRRVIRRDIRHTQTSLFVRVAHAFSIVVLMRVGGIDVPIGGMHIIYIMIDVIFDQSKQ